MNKVRILDIIIVTIAIAGLFILIKYDDDKGLYMIVGATLLSILYPILKPKEEKKKID